ncbi:acyl-CoA/acyl-ACP dehydrogenase [Actinosynnema pretiosum subsp. pretiosum]|uniref:Acyl-CoA/acyl-ACP dehydrogenase n=1 Tax=Actinosynnema pretiosum subsp. pretiosum TaxID=103721 RepID=A0AA45R4S2_9PSEU|nr:Acyl-CoA dehydrogenase, short-chain specific [Actinosynnema pretiosum subsp. pretiosum]QUF04923.1 acyl-CoA/acyl-ACP dehydrogenase [Actinosynnema pretiosum subsp. pretiosum]
MRFLQREHDTLEALLPGLDKALGAFTLSELEQRGGPGIAALREAGGSGLLVPAEHGGLGASARDAVRVTRAIATRSPSVAVAATMHNFSVASLVTLAATSTGFEWLLLDAVARDKRMMSSAFAEGRTGQGVLTPTMSARRAEGGWLVSGSKKPCSLSASMDLITASVALHHEDGTTGLGIAVIPAEAPGISVRPFWNSPVLAGAESDEVVLADVLVPDELVVKPVLDPETNLDDLNTTGLIWFNLLVSAVYLGVASALVARLLDSGRGDAATRVDLVSDLESAAFALDRVAWGVDTGSVGNDALADALTARYSLQRTSRRVVGTAVELLGGMAFVSSPDVALLAASVHALAFHPPGRLSTVDAMGRYHGGAPLRVD